ncbi:DUF3331 domain-containing protein [Pararobbsia alpina]|uniref:DUF3331 domain-containing protein n=1 Tax=Pararobbsia alpina TaxID=621374 RepID=A0A6S7AXM6_9BURK|nr:DUF3331 domain-containing protein [Pararobbsia alpina]CAB3776432.1 hypothetical protein LMG28138_00150 [Pararobbsia alpina]
MNGKVSASDPWPCILKRLLTSTSASECSASLNASHRLTVREAANDRQRHSRDVHDGTRRSACVVNVLDRLSERTVAVSWRDSTSCHYNDQIWRVGIARQPGRCAVTGVRIQPGEAIYRPIPTLPAPVNAQAMILASAISRVQAEV